jgi:NADH-quinone oxidoreductase subunit M
MFGKVDNPANSGLADLSARELATLVPLVVLAFWIGLYPSPFLRMIETSVGRVVTRVNAVYGPAVADASGAQR